LLHFGPDGCWWDTEKEILMVQKVIHEFNYLATTGEAVQFSLVVVVELLVDRHLGDQNVSEST